uniref:GIY-YIG endonuclease n=1 Tax=Morchella brunnea TaxID=1174671 RepID=A0A8K1I7V7_9PEZI|nr:GIY-YIG endonuclease [Morchella brunnea]UBU98486.1 GIY-YIG endonuclease [Morchella brunnea]
MKFLKECSCKGLGIKCQKAPPLPIHLLRKWTSKAGGEPSGGTPLLLSSFFEKKERRTLELLEASSYPSKTQAAYYIVISKDVLNYFLNTDKAEGVKGIHLYTRKLEAKKREALLKLSSSLELGNKIKVWANDAATGRLKLINAEPFPSLLDAEKYLTLISELLVYI